MHRPSSQPDAAASPSVELDLCHLRCPMPVLRTRKQLAGMVAGQVVRVSCTDPLAGIDIPHLVRQTGDELVTQAIDGGVRTFTIRKR